MSKFQIEVHGDLLIVTAPIAEFFAVYLKPTTEPQLILKRRTQTDDYVLLNVDTQRPIGARVPGIGRL